MRFSNLRQCFKLITLPGWVVLAVGFLYALDAIGLLRSWWARLESFVPGDLVSTMQSLTPYIAMFAGIAWIVWITIKVGPSQEPLNHLISAKGILKSFAGEARAIEAATKEQIKKLTIRAEKSEIGLAQRSSIMREFRPPDIYAWHEKVRNYIETELGPLEESVFHSMYEEIESEEIMRRFPEKYASYFNAQGTHLIHLSRRIDLTDLNKANT